MKALKVGYSFVMIALFVLTVVLGIAAFYPSPKRIDYPQRSLSTITDYNSPEYKTEQEKYNAELNRYDEKNKDVEDRIKIWGQMTFIVILVIGTAVLAVGLLFFSTNYFLSISLLFASFILIVFGQGITSYYADSTRIPFVTSEPTVDLTGYKQFQFGIALVGSVIGAALSFLQLNKTQEKAP